MTKILIKSPYKKQILVNELPQLTDYSKYEKKISVCQSQIESKKVVGINRIESNTQKDKKYSKTWFLSSSNFDVFDQQYIHIDQNILKIKTYFNASPQDRRSVRIVYARNIQKIQEVLIILSLGNSPNFNDAYDGAVALLAECNQDVLSESVEFFRQQLIQRHLTTSEEKNLEILIKSVACSSFVELARKLGLITTLFVKNLSSLIKIALIDALISLEDEVEPDLIKISLERFASEKEPDENVRIVAQKAISENEKKIQEPTLYDKFMESGLIGCCSVEEDLSTTYKQVLSDSLESKYDHR